MAGDPLAPPPPKRPKVGGRKKGTPNKLTSTARLAFMAVFGQLEGELEDWIRVGAKTDPLRAADILVKMAAYHFPKKTELTGKDGAPLLDFSVDLGRARE